MILARSERQGRRREADEIVRASGQFSAHDQPWLDGCSG
jgi:hypothetical protein